MTIATAILVLALPTAAAPDCASVDLASQFPDPAVRNQCDVGSCHAFGAVGLVEAAIFRKEGRKIRLSEADLFVTKLVTTENYYSAINQKLALIKAGESVGPGRLAEVAEGANMVADVQHIIDNGVAKDATVSYEAMLARYRRYREAEKKNALGEMEAEFKYQQNATWLDRFMQDTVVQAKSYSETATDDVSRRTIERSLLGGPNKQKQVEKDRAEIRGLVSDMQVVSESLPYLDINSDVVRVSTKCYTAGQRARDWTMLQLCRGRPVGVSIRLGGLPEWGQTEFSEHAQHAIILQGFEKRPDGSVKFSVRNSWGGFNPDVLDTQMCRVYAMAVVLGPDDMRGNGRAGKPAESNGNRASGPSAN